MTRVHLRTAQPLELMLHESDHEQLARAAAAAGYGVSVLFVQNLAVPSEFSL